MKKNDFLKELKHKIKNLDKHEVDDILSYYSELIDDRKEQGEDEEDIISSLGSIDLISNTIFEEKNIPVTKIEKVEGEIIEDKKKKKNHEMTIFKILILFLLFPLWISLGMIFLILLIVIFSLFLTLSIASIALIAVGLFFFVGSFIHFTMNVGGAIVQLGISFILIAIGLLFLAILPLFGKLSKRFIKTMKGVIR